MKRVFILILFFVFYCSKIIFAQVTINEPPIVTQMLERYVETNKNVTSVSGWRIQIFSTRDRVEMEKVRREFQFIYPNISVDWIHDRPQYVLRAGAFERKLDAYRLLNIIRQDYPSALISLDNNMNPAELIF